MKAMRSRIALPSTPSEIQRRAISIFAKACGVRTRFRVGLRQARGHALPTASNPVVDPALRNAQRSPEITSTTPDQSRTDNEHHSLASACMRD